MKKIIKLKGRKHKGAVPPSHAFAVPSKPGCSHQVPVPAAASAPACSHCPSCPGIFQILMVISTCLGLCQGEGRAHCTESHSDLANSIPVPQPKNLENVWLGTYQPARSQGSGHQHCSAAALLGFFCQWDQELLRTPSKWQTALTCECTLA